MYYRGAVYNIAENAQYQWAKRGENLLDEPMKANDHTRDAERYAVMAIDGVFQPPKVEVRRWI
jgi:phage terminase large subunit